MSQPKILFFMIAPTVEDKKTATESGLTVRDITAYSPTDFLENCDAVCGLYPPAYAARYAIHQFEENAAPQDESAKPKRTRRGQA